MTFNGEQIQAAAPTGVLAHHPHAAFTGHALSNALSNAYFQGRYGGPALLTQTYPPNRLTGEKAAVSSASLVAIARGWAYVDAQWTHAAASVSYAVRQGASVTLDLSVKDADVPTTANASATTVSTAAELAPDVRPVERFETSVSIKGLTLEAVCLVIIKAFAVDPLGNADLLVPVYANAWLEIRE